MSESNAGQPATDEQAKFIIERLGAPRKNSISYFCIETLAKGGTYHTNSKLESTDEIAAIETVLDAFDAAGDTVARVLVRPFDTNNRVFKLANGPRIF